MFGKEALKMTETMNKFEKATLAVQGNARGAKYKKGLAKVNLADMFMARGIKVHDTQNEK